MKPALSVIFFTVSSGAGLGLSVWLSLLLLMSPDAADSRSWWQGAALAALLVALGLASSTLHLANPRNAWRAAARFATSWLSREAVFSLLFCALAAALAALLRLRPPGAPGWPAALLAGLLLAAALAVLVCTAMIYGCLKTVPRWSTWHTPAGYPLLGLASGLLLFLAVPGLPELAARAGWRAALLAPALLGLGAALKAHYYLGFARPGAIPIDAALGLPPGRVRLLDAGHSGGTFLTNEFGFELARHRARSLKIAMFALAFALPAALLATGLEYARMAAALSCLAGLLVERWLYFAEARHVVRLYHGAPHV